MKRASWLALAVIVQGVVSIAHADGWDPTSRATNLVSEGMAQTRHNLSLTYLIGSPGFGPTIMEHSMNLYGEICVYCHTPHGANSSPGSVGMPLWNRTVNPNLDYTLYNAPTTLGFAGEQTVTEPGPASLTCLSCHDGVTAIDSIINMPGSNGYLKSQELGVNPAFLDQWVQTNQAAHLSLEGCFSNCHNGTSPASFKNFVIGAGISELDGSDLRPASNAIDLRDDHPIGVLYPTALSNSASVGFRVTNVEVPGRYAFFDDGNGRADKYEIRLYDSGDGFEVECASCHDPHGVPDAANVEFIPSFLRVDNSGSALCLTCHIK